MLTSEAHSESCRRRASQFSTAAMASAPVAALSRCARMRAYCSAMSSYVGAVTSYVSKFVVLTFTSHLILIRFFLQWIVPSAYSASILTTIVVPVFVPPGAHRSRGVHGRRYRHASGHAKLPKVRR